MGAAFDCDTGLVEATFPILPFVRGNGKSHMDRAVPVMRRNSSARKTHGLQRVAAQKQQQYAAMTDVVSAKPWIAINAVQAKNLFVERTGALERINIERGFENAKKVGHDVPFVMAGHSRLKNGVASLAYVPTIHILFHAP